VTNRDQADYDDPEEPEPHYLCPSCQMGTLRLRAVTFAHWFEGQFITIPRFPAWVCNICGAREYDGAALEQLELILGPEADLRREAAQRARRTKSAPQPAPRPVKRGRPRS
jgi:YgiT-type zinc finger domain-containing protein